MTLTTYAYIRVSTAQQDAENQRFEIEKFCKGNGLTVDAWAVETVSGTKEYDKRKLGELLEIVHAGDLIVCTEISRLGRSLYMVMEILNVCLERGAKVWTVKDGFRLGDDIQSKVIAFAFGLSAEIERNLISQRTKEALARKKAEGVRLGRKPGSHNKTHKLAPKEPAIRILLNEGCNYSQIARLLHVDRSTLIRYINMRCPELAPTKYKKSLPPGLVDKWIYEEHQTERKE